MTKFTIYLSLFIIYGINSFAQPITVTSPNGGESWQTGYEYTITWIDSIAEDVKIDLYKGGVFNSVLFDPTFSDGSKSWTIPVSTVPDSDYTIKITSVDSSNIFDFSDSDFTIFPSVLNITTPNGGESWQAGTTQTITWTDNIAENVSIDLYKGGAFYSVIVSGTASDGVRNWSIPFLQEGGSDYSVKITSVDNPDIFDFSDINFIIVGGEITVTSPNGGEDWAIGSFQDITWTEILVGNVAIDLFKSGVFHSEITGGTINDSVYIWEIPSSLDPASDYKIRISSVIDGSIFDFSDAEFTLSHEIIVSSPNGGESWQAGTDQSITWTDNIDEEVLIELYKGGSFHSVIATSTESDGIKEWSIPFTLESGSDYQVKISKVVDPALFDISDSNFTIVGNTVTVATPNGGEDWPIGSSQKISWTDNLTGNVEIQLHKGGIFHSLIATSTNSDGLYTWNISPTIESGTDYKVRIASVVDGNIFDFSDSSFTLSHQIAVTVPNGGEIWQAGSSQDIEWTDNLTGNVKIELFKGGIFDTLITSSATSNGEYTWDIPITTAEGSDYKIKVTSFDDSTVTDFSDADFTIFAGNIMVTSPNGSESWLAGSSQEITWSDNISGNVKIDLFKASVFYTEIVNSATSSGSFSWDISDTTMGGSDYKVKISSVENASLFDFSDADFTIFAGNITVTSPNGGESWLAGSSENITWVDNIDENVTIDLYKGGAFHSVISTSTSSDGSREWDIPFTLEAGSDYSVKITDVSNPNTFDFSDSNLTIISSQITVTSPNGGEQWLEGQDYLITWTDNLIGNVEIQLFKGGSFHSQIISSTPSDGSYTWEVSSSAESGSDYKVHILSVSNGSVFDFSDSNFTIINQDLTVVTPNGGESWLTSSTYDITWTDDISGDVKIDLYKAGVFYSEVTAVTPSNGLFSWTIPDTVATASDYKIIITSSDQPVLFDESNENFTIFTGGITVTSPNGGESWQAGSSQVITWVDNITEDISIDLYKGGVFYSVIDNQTSSDGSKDWNIPFNFDGGNDYQVKITSVDNPATVFDFSDSNFTIIANQVTVTSPNGGENWLGSEVQMITWTDNFSGSVEIQLFKNDVFYSSIIKLTPSDGAYSWNIDPTTPSSSDYKVKILSLDDGNVFDVSDSNFTIINNELRVVTPNGGESWLTNSSYDITWIDDISGDVKIDLYKAGVFDSEITAAAPSNGTFNWTIPDSVATGTDYKIRISSVDQPVLFDESDANFTIFTGGITVSSPNGGESWQAGSIQVITWADNITEDVTLDLYKGGVFNSAISTPIASDGSFDWVVPFTQESGTDYTVKITSIDNPSTVFDFSDSNFTIIANQVKVTSPNGGENWLASEVQMITWTDNLSGNVEIQLFKNDVFHSSIVKSTPSDGAYSWNIDATTPSASDYKVKILSLDDGNVFDVSDSNFTIINNELRVVTPNGGESWLTNSSYDITWTDDISGDVKIDLYKAGVFDSEITAATLSNGSYIWTIPDTVTTGTDYKIRITSVDQPVLYDISDANFTIFTGGITLSSPNGGESWQAGSIQVITWADNITEDVTIDLYKGGVFNSAISTPITSDGSFDWVVPFTQESGTDYTVKITSVDNPSTVFDFSDSNFTLIANQVTVISPNGGENWLASQVQMITWTDNLEGSVELQLFKNDIFHSSIEKLTPSDGAYSWNINPTTPSASDYKVKILSLDDGSVFDFSDSNFTIINNELRVVSPNGGESWLTNSAHDISWTDDISGDVKIDLYKAGVFDSEIAASTPSDGSYIWTIPDTVTTGTDYKIRITSVDQSVLYDISDANFTIFTGGITLVSPNGGESWHAGSSQMIAWVDNISEDVTIDLYKGGVFYLAISTPIPSEGSLDWTVPFTQESGSDYTVKITSVDNPATVFDFSDSNFTIVANQVTVTSPNGGENWLASEEQIINWIDNLTGDLEIQLFKNAVFHSSIVTSTPSDGEYTWNIEANTPTGSDYKVKILSVDDGSVFDLSDSDFTIINNELTVVAPNGGESWLTSSAYDITWTDDISGDVKIDLYKAGVFDSEIAAAVPSNGTFNWTIPDSIATGSDYKIRITSVDQPVLFDESDANFTIFTGQITVSSPNGGESWQAGSSQVITWADNITEDITIDLYKGGAFHSVISTPIASDGSFDWNIPFTQESGTDYTVKITSVDNPATVFDFSDSNFTLIANQVTVTSPNGGENWLASEEQIITWTDNLAGSVELQLFKNDVFQSSIVTSTPSDGEYTWNIAATTPSASDYKVKIISVEDGSISDLSDSNFTIISNELTVVTPNGGESWLTSSTYDITWADDISGDVKIDLYKAGVFDSEIAASTPSNGTFSWNIPGTVATGSDYKVRITSVDQPVLYDRSDANFTIFTGGITVISPNGGESWQAGSSQLVTWADNITEDVTIDLYKGGVFHSAISTPTANDGSFDWVVPFNQESGTDYTVKITSVDNPATVFDFSDSNFTIIANQITVTSPNGGENWLTNTSEEIIWTDNIDGDVEIQLFKGGVFLTSISTSTPSDGSFTWNIPTSIVQSSDYNVRISSVFDGNINDLSDEDFTISNDIIVTAPNVSEIWQTGTIQNITWTDNFDGDVKIELFKTGVFHSEITPSTPSDGSFSWDISESTLDGSDYTIKLTSLDNISVFDFSDGDFEIFNVNITIISPNGGENWQAGTSQNIIWSDNISANVTIDLYKGGVFHSVISTATESDGSLDWDIPFTLESGTDYTVKITSVNGSGIFDFSDTTFRVIGNQVTVTSPNGGENWLVAEDQIISWTDNLEGSVEIQLFKNDVFHSSIVTSTPSDGEFTWNIPDNTPSGSNYNVKIISVDDGSVSDQSDANFIIISNELAVDTPNGGESWLTNSAYDITWTDDISGDVKIDLYRGGVFDSEIAAATPSDGIFNWNIPGTVATGSDYKIRIASVDQPVLFDESNANFTIFTGGITVISPNGGESWQAGSSQVITWADNITDDVTIDLYKGGVFHSVISIPTASDGSVDWNIPFTLESGVDYTVKITSVDNPGTIFDFSDADFTIVGNQITVISPNGGENWLATEDQIISWTDNLEGSVEIQLFKNDVFYSSIGTLIPSDGEYTWNIPATTPSASDYKVKIVSINDGNIFDLSNADFTIISYELAVDTPNGGESWLTSISQEITWTDDISGDVKIDLYRAGVFDSEIAAATPSDGSYSWNIPGNVATGSDYKIRITSVDQPVLFDESNANFTIFTGGITVISPNGGESWQAGSSQVITWADNITEDVSIDLYKGGVFHSVISTSTASNGSLDWDIPFTLESGADYTVKITSMDNPTTTFDFSDANFTIVGNQITVASPNGGENWLATEDQIISWTDNLEGSVEIQLFKNDVYHSLIVTSTPSDGEYTWNIPATTPSASDYKVKIVSIDDGNIFDLSDADFTIISYELTVDTPNGGESWLTSISQEITWTDDISGDVKIDLYRAGVFDSEIAAATPSDGSYSWNIPGTVATGSDYKIRITSVDQPVLFDESNANFTIFTGGITVSSPNGGESWQAGSSHVITWADNITEDVSIDLYKGGVFHSVISTSTASNGSLDWDIPFTLESGADYTVKITSMDNPTTTFDFSDANFTIVGNQITVASPNGGENCLNSEDQMITWTDNFAGSVEIQLFKNDVFHSSIVTSTPSDGEYTWNIPETTPSASDYKIKIVSIDDGNIFDLSDADFTIIGNELTVDTPNGGESWLTSISQEITWTDDISGDVKIDLYKAGAFDSEIAATTPSDGSYSWNIPGTVATGADYKIRITSLDQPVLFDESNEIFTIYTGAITVSSPNGAESWQAGSSHVITWSDNITEDVTIELYKGGAFHSVISASTESSGSLDWQMPFDLEDGSDYSVRISSAENTNVIYDFADADFTIIANQITVTSPNGSENWQVESTQTITWNDNIDGNVEIQLFKAGNYLTSISESTVSDGIHEWIVPADLEAGSDYVVKVLSVDHLGTYDESNADFTVIANQITLSSPNNGESWKIGSQQIISWVDNLTGNIEVQLFKSGEFHLQIESSISSDNSYTWNIPITLEQASDYKIKILSENDGNICDYSDENFTLLSEIIVGVPNGLEKWQAGTLQDVEWVDNITHNVMIDLYKGGSFHSNISNSVESNGSRQWDIPFNLESGSDYSIKITSATNPDIYDFSDNDFSIEGKVIAIMSPSEDDTWQAGTTQEIAWWDNFNENVKIALYKGDEFHSEIDASNGNDGTKFWKIPFIMEQGNDYNIKMKSVDDPNPYKSSTEHYFNIVANEITDVSPAGGEKWLIGSVQEIIWSDNLEGDVEILLYKSGVLYTSIASATASDGFYTWTVPQIEQGPDYKVKILSVVTAEVYSESDSNFIITTTIELNDILSGVPSTYELYQNFPNPFNPSTTIYYGIPKDGPVDIFIYDLLGNQILHYREDMQAAGYHKIDFNATGLASGVYVYRISARLFVETKKMMLIR